MLDANGSRFALVLGQRDWGACTLDAAGAPRLADLWADETPGVPLAYDETSGTLALARRVGRFRAGQGDLPADPALRLGAAADRHGNIYAIVDGGQRIEVRSVGSGRTSDFWPAPPPDTAPAAGEFTATRPAAPPAPLHLAGLAVTCQQYLVAGIVPPAGASGGLLVFDLIAGGPPLELAWPQPWRLVPHDMAARPHGGLAVLDRENRRVWMLDRRLGMSAVFPTAPQAPSDFVPSDGSDAPPAPPPARPWFDLAATALGGTDPVAIEVLADGAVLVLDAAGSDGFALLGLYVDGRLAAQASTIVARSVIAPEDQAAFTLRGFEMALHARTFAERQRVIVVPADGNQCLAFNLDRDDATRLVLVPDPGFLPLKRYRGLNLVGGSAATVEGDTGLFYESLGRWLPLVEQRRPRYQPLAALVSAPFDGQDPGCVWHRLMLDACIPAGCRVRVSTRAADEPGLLADLPFEPEPLPVLRPDGSELPWLIEGPGSHTDAVQGHGCWELLLQRARGRWLQVKLAFEGNELATPRLAALRAWRPRFSYSARYLPAAYREDAGAADFLERFLANFEGQFTSLEDRITAAGALFDVRSAPAETLDWLAGWLGLVLDPALDEGRRRQLIRHAVPLFAYRGTTQATRLAVQLALSRCVPEQDFALPAPSQLQPWGVRIVESYLARNLPPALLGETTFGDAPRSVTPGVQWTPAEGADGLQARWQAWLTAAGKPTGSLYGPLPPNEALRADWQAFSQAVLGAVPQLAQQFQAAWQGFVATHADLPITTLPDAWPQKGGTDPEADARVDLERQGWIDFMAGLPGSLRRWVQRWQGFVARRHLRMADYRSVTGSTWPEFELLPVPATLPANPAVLADWALFETRLEPMAAKAHSFSVLLPIPGPQADANELAQQVDLATRVLRIAKPAHTRFDVRPYWALFRIGQVRLGLDTLLGLGAREPGVAPALVLGSGHIGAARVAPRPKVPDDRMLLEC
jgi:phage tail-like protein